MKFHFFRKTNKKGKSASDFVLALVLCILTVIGIVMVYDSSVALALRDFSDKYYYVKEQLKWAILGMIICFITSRVDYRIFRKLAGLMFIGTILLLIFIFIPEVSIKAMGARRWIHLGSFVFQPAELAKITLILYLSAWVSSGKKRHVLPFLLLVGCIAGPVMLQPDLGTAAIISAIAIILYFVSGAPIMQFFFLVPIFVCILGALAVFSQYRFERLMTFINPQSDPLGSSYQIRQATLALGSGGLFGVGIGKSRQKYEYLPEANTDSIFAIIGEETGFTGTLSLIILYVCVVWRGFRIARLVHEPFAQLVALGISSWFGIQAAMNMAAMVGLIPLTGIPLPFISYGGSSLILFLFGFGIVMNISTHIPYEHK